MPTCRSWWQGYSKKEIYNAIGMLFLLRPQSAHLEKAAVGPWAVSLWLSVICAKGNPAESIPSREAEIGENGKCRSQPVFSFPPFICQFV